MSSKNQTVYDLSQEVLISDDLDSKRIWVGESVFEEMEEDGTFEHIIAQSQNRKEMISIINVNIQNDEIMRQAPRKYLIIWLAHINAWMYSVLNNDRYFFDHLHAISDLLNAPYFTLALRITNYLNASQGDKGSALYVSVMQAQRRLGLVHIDPKIYQGHEGFALYAVWLDEYFSQVPKNRQEETSLVFFDVMLEEMPEKYHYLFFE